MLLETTNTSPTQQLTCNSGADDLFCKLTMRAMVKSGIDLRSTIQNEPGKNSSIFGELWADGLTPLPMISLQVHYHLKRHRCCCCQWRVQKRARHLRGWLFSACRLARNHNGEDAPRSPFKQQHGEKTTWRSAHMNLKSRIYFERQIMARSWEDK